MPKAILNPLHSEESQLYPKNTGEFVAVSGDTMTGDLQFPVSGFLMEDNNGVIWRVTIGTDGAIVTESGSAIPNAMLTELSEYLLTEAGAYLIQE